MRQLSSEYILVAMPYRRAQGGPKACRAEGLPGRRPAGPPPRCRPYGFAAIVLEQANGARCEEVMVPLRSAPIVRSGESIYSNRL
jgi:hypothetical protein